MAHASVESTMISAACAATIAAASRVTASCGARVASVSSILAMSATSVTVVTTSACGYARQRALHDSTVPTAGGHAQVLPYMGHSLSQMARTRSVKTSSPVLIHAY